MKINGKIIGFFLAGLVLLPGCMHVRRYRPQSLKMLRDKTMHTETKKDLTVRVKRLTEFEKEYLFNKHIGRLEGNLFQVIYVSINNMSKIQYELRPDSIDLERVSYAGIVKQMKKTSTAGRAIISGLTANYAIFGAQAIVNVSSGLFLLAAGPFVALSGIVAVVTGIRAIKSVVMNKRISSDLKEKILDEKSVIKAYDRYEGLIFVQAANYRSDFVVKMHEKDNLINVVAFDVNLDKS